MPFSQVHVYVLNSVHWTIARTRPRICTFSCTWTMNMGTFSGTCLSRYMSNRKCISLLMFVFTSVNNEHEEIQAHVRVHENVLCMMMDTGNTVCQNKTSLAFVFTLYFYIFFQFKFWFASNFHRVNYFQRDHCSGFSRHVTLRWRIASFTR